MAVCIVAAVFFADALPATAQKRLPDNRAQVELSYAPLVRKAAPAVVNIYTRKVVRTRQVSPLFNDPFFRRFFGDDFGFGLTPQRKRIQNSLGSGVIVGADGVVVTNHHAIEGADEITVVLSDRREFDADIVGADERTDLAVLRINTNGKPLPHLELMDSDLLEVGDIVLAIGNPFGVGQTVTSGIVSALARTQVGIADLNFFIQTDAAINPGNSGGALVGMNGKLAGVNTAIFSKSGGSQGIGFAVPANMVRTVIDGLLSGGGNLVRPWFGASGQEVNADIAASLGLDRPGGVLVNKVYAKGPAMKSGLKPGDVILSINDIPVSDPNALKYRIATLSIGKKAYLSVLRKGRTRRLALPLSAPPEDPPREITELSGKHPLSGATVVNMSPALSVELGLKGFIPGVFIMEVRRGSPASRFRFRPGDKVLEINGREIGTVKDLKRRLSRKRDKWDVTINRGGEVLSLNVGR